MPVRNRCIVSYNSAFLKLSQCQKKDIVNRNIREYFTGNALSNLLNEAGAEISFEIKKVPFNIDAIRAVIAETDFPNREWWEKQYS